MKKVLCTWLAFFLLPFVLVGAVIYALSSVLELLFRTINLGINYCVLWIDKNITPNII